MSTTWITVWWLYCTHIASLLSECFHFFRSLVSHGTDIFLDCYTFMAKVCLLFNPSGRKQLNPIVSTPPMDNNKKAKHTFREKPGLKPWFIDHAKALPATTGATALKVKIKTSQCHLSVKRLWRHKVFVNPSFLHSSFNDTLS